MKVQLHAIAVALLSISLLGCSDDDDDHPAQPAASAQLRVIHASADAPAVNIIAGGATAVSALEFEDASDVLDVAAGTLTVAVEGILPGDDATVIGPVDLDLDADTRTDVIALNAVSSIEPLLVTVPAQADDAGAVRVTVVHGSPAAPQVDVYVTAPGADLAASTPVGTFAFKQTLGPVEIPAADYQIRVTAAGDSSAVVFDSGTVSLAAGKDLLIVAIPNTQTGSQPINLLVVDGNDDATLLDVNAGADLRVAHLSADAPAVDIVVNDNVGTPLVDALAFPTATGYVNVPADTYNVKVAADADNAVVVIDADLTLAAGTAYSVFAVGQLASIEPLVLEDDRRRIATEARVRLVHASSIAGNVDIYVTAPGADINSLTPTLSAVPFKADTGLLSLAAGDYSISVTPANSKTVALGPLDVTLENGKLYTAVARDNATLDGVDVLLLDDFVN